jgi:hypothetical protein
MLIADEGERGILRRGDQYSLGQHTSASCLQLLQHKLKSTMDCLTDWSSLKLGTLTKEINSLKSDLERLQASQGLDHFDQIEAMSQRLHELLLR